MGYQVGRAIERPDLFVLFIQLIHVMCTRFYMLLLYNAYNGRWNFYIHIYCIHIRTEIRNVLCIMHTIWGKYFSDIKLNYHFFNRAFNWAWFFVWMLIRTSIIWLFSLQINSKQFHLHIIMLYFKTDLCFHIYDI